MDAFPTNTLTTTNQKLVKGITYAAMLLDASGSMRGEPSIQLLEGAADFLEEMREVEVPVHVAFDLFSSQEDYERGQFKPAHATPYLTKERYGAAGGGGTALLDGIHEVVAHVAKEKRPQDRAIVSIFTDGQENESRHTLADTRKLVLAKQAEGWIFIFAGPHSKFASSIGIEPQHQFALKGGNIRGVLEAMTKSVVQALLPAKGGTICL